MNSPFVSSNSAQGITVPRLESVNAVPGGMPAVLVPLGVVVNTIVPSNGSNADGQLLSMVITLAGLKYLLALPLLEVSAITIRHTVLGGITTAEEKCNRLDSNAPATKPTAKDSLIAASVQAEDDGPV